MGTQIEIQIGVITLANQQIGTIRLADGSKIYMDDGNSCSHLGRNKGICIRCLKHLQVHQLPLEQSCLKFSWDGKVR